LKQITHVKAFLLASCLSSAGAAFGQSDQDLSVDHPFVSSTAVDNLNKCVKNLPPDALNALPQIQSMYYEFDPAKGGDGSDSSPDVSVTRHLIFDIPQLTLGTIAHTLQSLNSDACSLTVRVSYPHLAISGGRHIVIDFHVDTRAWDCGSFLGISYKLDEGGASADIKEYFEVNDDLNIVQERSPDVYNVSVTETAFFDFIGFALPEGPLLAGVLNNMIQNELSHALASMKSGLGDQSGTTGAFLALSSGAMLLSEYTKALDLTDDIVWQLTTDGALSGFLSGRTDDPWFDLVQVGSVPGGEGPDAYSMRKAEIAFIRDLAKPSPRMYTASAGDSLWSISKSTYADWRTFLLVQEVNQLRGKKLAVGKAIRLPLLYELCEHLNQDLLVRPGDSVYAIGLRKGSAFNPRPSYFISGRLNLIYPYEGLGALMMRGMGMAIPAAD
jgi:hypothetical protein